MVCFLIAFITVQQVCALAALTVRKLRPGTAENQCFFQKNHKFKVDIFQKIKYDIC